LQLDGVLIHSETHGLNQSSQSNKIGFAAEYLGKRYSIDIHERAKATGRPIDKCWTHVNEVVETGNLDGKEKTI